MRVPLEEITFSFARSSGPGGQNVNKVSSKAVLRWNVGATAAIPPAVKERFLRRFGNKINQEGELVIQCDESRDQSRNKAICLRRVEEMLRSVARPPKPRRPTKPTRSSKEKRVRTKKQHGEKKKLRKVPVDF